MVSYLKNSAELPALSRHQSSSQGVVRLNGRDVYCGKHGTPECEAKYHATIASWLANGRSLPAGAQGHTQNVVMGLTVNEMAEAFLGFAEGYYQKNGKPTSKIRDIKSSIRPLHKLFGTLPVAEFTPAGLKAVRQSMVDSDVCRNEVNKRYPWRGQANVV